MSRQPTAQAQTAARPATPAERLVSWFRAHARTLPFRQPAADPRFRRDPYAVWVSEAMLQQTQVATVVTYFARFMQRFPTVADLAAADIDDVLQMWSGLGYYRRARFLHAGARHVMATHSGTIPDDPTDLRAIPGVGAYMAGAIASLAFDRAVAAIDGNVLRVVARLTECSAPVGSRVLEQTAQAWVRQHQPCEPTPFAGADRRNRPSTGGPSSDATVIGPGDFNEALFELGATVCTPRRPHCERCPLAGKCQARVHGSVAGLPVPRPRKERPEVKYYILLIDGPQDSRLWARRSEHSGLFRGLWELPMLAPDDPTLPHLANACGIRRWRTLGSFAHDLTHRRLSITVRTGRASSTATPEVALTPWDRLVWLPLDADPPGGISAIAGKARGIGVGRR